MTVTINTWVATADVPTITGVTVTDQEVATAQVMIENVIHRVWRVTDAEKRDYVWLQRACAFQAVYIHQHPEVLTMMGVQSMSQDGMSLTFPQNARIFLAPLALMALDNLFRAANSTIRLNSAFQKNRLRRVGYGLGATIPWGSI